LRARVLGDSRRPGAEGEFQELQRLGLVTPQDRGNLFCFPSREQIMKDTGIGSVHTVDSALAELTDDLRLIRRVTPKKPRLKAGRFSSNLYIIHPESFIGKFDSENSHHEQKLLVVKPDQEHQVLPVSVTESSSPRAVNCALKRSTFTTTTTTTGDAFDINSQIAAIFATAIGAERYDPTEKESRQIAALLADGYSAEDIGAGIQRAVHLAAARGQRVRSLAYCIPEIRNPSVRSATEQDTKAETSERTAETDVGTPKPTAVAGNSPVETEPVVRRLQIESQPKAALSLDALANGNAELRDLLDVIQAKNPTRVIDRGDVRAWLKLADNFAELAQKRDTSPVGLVMQAVLEAIGANSDREGFLAPNLARRILERWQKEAVAKGRTEEEEPSTRSTVSSDHLAVVADPAGKRGANETANAPSQYLQTLAGVGSAGEIWSTAQKEIALQMTRATFDSWIRPARALGWENGHDDSTPTLVVGVHSPYAKEWLEARLNVTVQRTVTRIVGRAVGIRYVAPVDKRA